MAEMQEGEKKEIDPKVAKLIEGTEESLRNMEKTLGPDHPVVAKILDTYAKLLRQHNYRIIDAINMEARAKAIRAKHNQEEADAQAKMIGTAARPVQQGMSTSKVKLIVWAAALVVGGGIAYAAMQTMNSVTPTVGRLKALKAQKEEQKRRAEEEAAAADKAAVDLGAGPAPAIRNNASGTQPSEEDRDKQRRKAAELQKEHATIQQEIAQLVAHGQEFEAGGSSNDAAEAYQTAYNAGVRAPRNADGSPFACEEMATALERLIAMAQPDSPDTAALQKTLDQLRSQLNGGSKTE